VRVGDAHVVHEHAKAALFLHVLEGLLHLAVEGLRCQTLGGVVEGDVHEARHAVSVLLAVQGLVDGKRGDR